MPVLLGVVAAITALKLGNGFVFDDNNLIVRGRVIHDPSRALEVFTHSAMWAAEEGDAPGNSIDTYRPISILSFFWDAALSGRDPWSYHLTNLLVHLACTYLVFLLARRLLPPSSLPFAPLAAALFGLNPQLAEAHVWINGRSDIFAVLFGLSALLIWDRANRDGVAVSRRAVLWTGSGLLFLLGLMSKEVLIGVLPAIWLWPTANERRGRFGARTLATVPFVAAGAVYLALRANALGSMRTHADATQVWAAMARYPLLLVDGLVHAVAPRDLYLRSMRDDYGAHGLGTVVVCSGVILALGLLCLRLWRRAPLALWAAAWFALPLAPVSVVATVLWLGFGRYLYLPMVGLSIVLAALAAAARQWLGVHAPRARPVAMLALCGYLGTLAFALSGYVRDFRDEERLYRAIVREAPHRAHGHGWLGMHFAHHRRPEDAAAAFARASQLDPGEPRYLLGYGTALLSLGKAKDALAVAQRGIARLSPTTEFHMLAAASLVESDPARAREHLVTCLRQKPTHPVCHRILRALSTGQ